MELLFCWRMLGGWLGHSSCLCCNESQLQAFSNAESLSLEYSNFTVAKLHVGIHPSSLSAMGALIEGKLTLVVQEKG